MSHGNIGVKRMKLLLSLNRGESIEDELAGTAILDNIAFDIVGDIFDKISKESDLLDLIKNNKL
jgi:hypothetical protein